MITDVFLNQKRVDVCEHTVKMGNLVMLLYQFVEILTHIYIYIFFFNSKLHPCIHEAEECEKQASQQNRRHWIEKNSNGNFP